MFPADSPRLHRQRRGDALVLRDLNFKFVTRLTIIIKLNYCVFNWNYLKPLFKVRIVTLTSVLDESKSVNPRSVLIAT